MDADPDSDTDRDTDLDPYPDPRPEFLRVKKYLKNIMHFFQAFLQILYEKKIENVFRKLVFSL